MNFDEWLVKTAVKDIEHYISTESDADISYSHYMNGQYRVAYNLYKQFIKETSGKELISSKTIASETGINDNFDKDIPK